MSAFAEMVQLPWDCWFCPVLSCSPLWNPGFALSLRTWYIVLSSQHAST